MKLLLNVFKDCIKILSINLKYSQHRDFSLRGLPTWNATLWNCQDTGGGKPWS